MKRFLLAAAAVTASLAVPAQAADLARPAPPVYAPPPPIIAVFTWTGCYVGANGGGIWSQKTFTNTNFIPGFAGVVPGFGPVVLPAVANGADFGSQTVSGGLGGGRWLQSSRTGVFGIQGDYDGVGARGREQYRRSASASARTNHVEIAPASVRAGSVTPGPLSGYVKAGAPGCATTIPSKRAFLGGLGTFASERNPWWTVGIGGEYVFLDWPTGFAEYDFYGFGTKTSNFNCGLLVRCIRPHTFG
jgi:outer membrane immunogenic protein